MPPDVFLMLCSSGIALVASLMFFVSEDRPPLSPPDDPSQWVSFMLPPLRLPPPLPDRGRCRLNLALGGSRHRFTLCCTQRGEQWSIAIESEPLADSPALQISEGPSGELIGTGAVHDIRWSGRAGLARKTRSEWRGPPAKA